MSLKIKVEDKIPYIKGALEPYGHVTYLPSEAIDADAMRDADALITRTRTRCDASLLEDSRCQFIATATIGTDHIDLDYCRNHGIEAVNAPGCNAPAVAQWVLASALTLRNELPSELVMGIVGVGHVGRQLETWARQIGYRLLLCDPPRALAEGPDRFVDLGTIAREADIITFHTPLTRQGQFPTYHLADADFFQRLERQPLVMNAARGPVVDTQALIQAIHDHRTGATAIDTWEGEPQINPQLLALADIATPHIAGYSKMGKIRATAMALDAFARHFQLPKITPVGHTAQPPTPHVTPAAILSTYSPLADTATLRAILHPDRSAAAAPSAGATFEHLRDHYPLRPEP